MLYNFEVINCYRHCSVWMHQGAFLNNPNTTLYPWVSISPFYVHSPLHYRASYHCNDLNSVKSTEYYLLFRRCDKIPCAKVTYRKSLFWIAVTEGESSTGDDQSRRLSYHIWITHREHRARTGSGMGCWLSKPILSDTLLPEKNQY